MTDKAHVGPHILGTLGAVDGKGIVRIQDRFDTDVDDLWAALTDPGRLVRWLGDVDGDLRMGGQFRARFFSSGWEGTGRVQACDAPQHFTVVTKELDESAESVIRATLTADGDQTVLVIEEQGMPLNLVAGYGAGIQVHIEDLGAHIGGRERCDSDARMNELYPAYQDLAVRTT